MRAEHDTSARPELTIALAGDTMLGRGVAEVLEDRPGKPVVDEAVVEAAADADLFLINLECCISGRGRPWPDRAKRFFFRAPPRAAEVLAEMGVDCVTLANNHALDFGEEALLDTMDHLRSAGIAWAGAGRDESEARAGRILEANGRASLGVAALSDHPRDFAARADRPGIAFAELRARPHPPAWLLDELAGLREADAVLVSPHWGPNMTPEPVGHVRDAAQALRDADVTLIAGHSAHVFHGVAPGVIFDLGDFVDDYRVDPELRNDLGLLFLVTIGAGAVRRVEAVPLALDYCHTRLATSAEAGWIARRLDRACAALGTAVEREGDRLVVGW